MAYAYLPPDRSDPGTAVELDMLRRLGSEARWTSEPLFDPSGERVRGLRVSPARDPAAPYNEAYDENGQPRPHYAAVLDALGDPAHVAAEVKRRLSARGVSWGGVPRILTQPEWSELSGRHRAAAGRP